MSNPLWDYSLAIYRLDEVAPTCLILQDTFGLDVNLLLYAAWLAQINLRLSADHLVEMEALIVDWRENVIQPVRALRRQLRDWHQAQALRDEIEALELHAEQQQQDMMYAFYQQAAQLPEALGPLRDNLATVAQLASPVDNGWSPTVEHLASLLRV